MPPVNKINMNAKENRKSYSLEVISTRQSALDRELSLFMENITKRRFLEISEQVKNSTVGQKKTVGGKLKLRMPISTIAGFGNQSEQTLMAAFGWYWEPLLYDLAFFDEMRVSVSLISGQIQKMMDTALCGFRLANDDPKVLKNLNELLVYNQNVNLRESIRRCMIDMFTLGNTYTKPEWTKTVKGMTTLEVIRPIRSNAVRKLRNEKLATEGYVQLLHRPSEFILGGTPHTPTIYLYDEILCGMQRSYGWYAYGEPLLASLPLMVRLKLTMERDLAEMLHQHLPRVVVTFSPDEQMNQEQVDAALGDLTNKISQMRPTDNFSTTPDVKIDYVGPQGHALDFSSTQKHIEEQLFYVLPFAPSIMGLDSKSNPYDSQQHWTVACHTAYDLRSAIDVMFRPMFRIIEEDWGCSEITIAYDDLDPEMTQKHAETDEYVTNNAVLKRDNGFLDQDTAAIQATAHHPDGPVKKAAKPGAIPPPVDNTGAKTNGIPNSPKKSGNPKPSKGKQPVQGNGKVRSKGPKKDGTAVPDKDNRPKGKRHSFQDEALTQWAIDELEEED
jgi:hypothetical protein